MPPQHGWVLLPAFYMGRERDEARPVAIAAMENTASMQAARDAARGGPDPVRLTHHTEKVAFPRDGKKAKTYFQNLEDGYDRIWCVDRGKDTYRAEVTFYRERYGAMVEAHNQACVKARHMKRMMSVQDLHGRQRTCPEVLAIQTGRKGGAGMLGREVFVSCIMQYLSWTWEWSEGHGDCLHVLDVYVSKDPPYRAVIRRVWDCLGKDGIRKVGMTGALRAAGVPYPDPEAEESRFNNRKMMFDRMSREKLYACFEDAGISVIREPGIYTLRKALEVKKKTDAEEQYARDMLREIMEVEAQAPPMAADGDVPDVLKGPGGCMLVPEGDYRMLKIRECLAGAYAAKNQAADRKLLEALGMEREAQEACAVQKGIKEAMELEYAALRMGLLRCGYYAGDGKGGEADESISQ